MSLSQFIVEIAVLLRLNFSHIVPHFLLSILHLHLPCPAYLLKEDSGRVTSIHTFLYKYFIAFQNILLQYNKLAGKSKLDCKAGFLKILCKLPTFGSAFFEVTVSLISLLFQ